tara:strand:- start:395 stop:787 length:393 start_codon:yes stop_codon:yes gene_type:complete
MKICVLICFFISAVLCNAQVKKKDQGTYKGLIPEYKINTSQELISVDSCTIQIKIEKNTCHIKLDNLKYEGTYKLTKKDKRTYVLKVKTDYSDIEEQLILFGKEKKIKRKGIFPQPNCELIKLKKREVLW